MKKQFRIGTDVIEPWYRQWWFIFLLLIVCTTIIVKVNKNKILTSINNSISASVAKKYYPKLGDIILIGSKEKAGGIVARNPQYLMEYIEAGNRNDSITQTILHDSDKVFEIKNYTVALVMDINPVNQIVKVRMLEGQHYGEAGYTLDKYCMIKKTITAD